MHLYHDSEGTPLYTLQVNGKATPPPGDFIEIAEDPGELSGLRVVDGVLIRESLAPLQAQLLERANEVMAETRSLYITVMPGQEMIYQAKENEAKAYISADPEPADLADYPLMAAEVGKTTVTAYELAQLWLNMSAQWRFIASQLEPLRLDLKDAATAALSEAELETLEADFLSAIETFKTNHPAS